MVLKSLHLLPLLIMKAYSADLGTNLGESLGYAFIGIISFSIMLTGLFIVSRPKNKGIASSLLQLIIFLQFARCTNLLNFSHSNFSLSFWMTFSKIQSPFDFFTCKPSTDPWTRLGLNSTNFLCNSFFQFLIIFCAIFIWAILPLFSSKIKGKRWMDFIVFMAYCSTIDLSVSAFLQLLNVRNYLDWIY